MLYTDKKQIFMKDLELRSHRIDFDAIAEAWRRFTIIVYDVLADTRLPAVDFGEVRPSASDVRRHVKYMRDTSMEKGYTRYFRVRKLKFKSRRMRTRYSSSDDADASMHREKENEPDTKDSDMLNATKRASGHPPNTSIREALHVPKDLSSEGETEEAIALDLTQYDSDDLPEVSTIIAGKDKHTEKDDVKLRSISRPSFEGHDVLDQDDDDSYDPAVERAAEESRQEQRKRRGERATSVLQQKGV